MKKWQTELFLSTRPSVNSIGRFITATLITFACISLKSVAAPIVYVQETVPGTQQWFTNLCAIKSIPPYLAIDSSPPALLSQCKNDTYMMAKPVVAYPYFCELSPIYGRATGLNNDQNSSLICRQYNEVGVNVSAGIFMEMSTIYSCPVTTPPEVSWTYSGTLQKCERWVPASPTACPVGQVKHPYGGCMLACPVSTHVNLDNTACVPDDSCPVPYLQPINSADVLSFEANPDLSDTTRLTPAMYTAMNCLVNAANTNPKPTVGSAYRPLSYNRHLIDAFDNRQELMANKTPACAARRVEADKHLRAHKVIRRPVLNSKHTRGLAIDVTINLPPARIDAIAKGCGLFRPEPGNDKVHFTSP
jgi:hypothetical protein